MSTWQIILIIIGGFVAAALIIGIVKFVYSQARFHLIYSTAKKVLVYFYIKFKGDQKKIIEAIEQNIIPDPVEQKLLLKGVKLKEYLIPFDKEWDFYLLLHHYKSNEYMCIKK